MSLSISAWLARFWQEKNNNTATNVVTELVGEYCFPHIWL